MFVLPERRVRKACMPEPCERPRHQRIRLALRERPSYQRIRLAILHFVRLLSNAQQTVYTLLSTWPKLRAGHVLLFAKHLLSCLLACLPLLIVAIGDPGRPPSCTGIEVVFVALCLCIKADSDEAERLRKHPDSWGSRIRMPGKLV